VCARVCVCVCHDVTGKLDDFCHRHLACWFILTLSRSSSTVNVKGQSSRSHDEKCSFFGYGYVRRDSFLAVCRVLCAKVVDATTSEVFLVNTNSR